MKIQLVNDNDELIGTKERSEINFATDIYRVSALWLSNSQGQVLLAKRAMNKDKDPGKWGPAVAGTNDEGETYDQNIYKEAQEEIGLTGVIFNKDKKIRSTSPRNSFTQWYRAVVDKEVSDFTRQVEEVDQLAWVDSEVLKQELLDNPEKFIPAMPAIVKELNI